MYTTTMSALPITSGAIALSRDAINPIVMTKKRVPTNSVRYLRMGRSQWRKDGRTEGRKDGKLTEDRPATQFPSPVDAPSSLELPHPDIPVPHRMTVILQRERQPVGVRLVGGPLLVAGGAGERDVVLHQHAVMEDGHPRRAQELALAVEAGPVEDDVVGLPLPRWPARVDERGILPVHRGRLAVGVGRGVPGG